jgi:hypothetical protein
VRAESTRKFRRNRPERWRDIKTKSRKRVRKSTTAEKLGGKPLERREMLALGITETPSLS